MNLVKYLNYIHGWLPKEVNSPSCRQATAYKFFPTHRATVAYVMLVAGPGFVGGLLEALGYILGISSELGVFWPMITGMIIGIAGALIYGKVHRKEQRRAKI